MLVCPHCQNPVELDETAWPEEVVCATCGSSFRIERERTRSYADEHRCLGKFELLDEIGMGAFGVVWKARDTDLNRLVAVKIPHAGRLFSKQDEERFVREGRSAARLRHPGIVSVHDVGRHEGLPYLVADFIDGITLADMLTGRRLSFQEAAELVAQLSEALHYAHTMGVVHRDIKPSNIILERSGQGAGLQPRGVGKPLLMDFGLALRPDAEVTMTIEGQILGTPAYMSPEQAAGLSHKVDARSDIYSLGVVFYQLLAGELPFRGNSRMVLDQVLREEPRPPRRLNDKIPRDLETICLKAMAKEPGRRYADTRALGDDLGRFLQGEPIQARPLSPWEQGVRWVRRRPAVAALLAISVAAVLTLTSGSLWYNMRLREANRQYEQQRDLAQENFRLARQAVDDYFIKVSENTLLQSPIPGLQPLRKELLESALKYYQEFLAQWSADPALQAETAAAFFRVGNITAEIASKKEALKAMQNARELYEELSRTQPETTSLQNDLAKCYRRIGDLQIEIAEPEKALESYRKAISIGASIGAESSSEESFQNELAKSYRQMALAQRDVRQPAEAYRSFKRAIAIGERLVKTNPTDSEFQADLAESYDDLSHFQYNAGQPKEGLASCQKAIELVEGLAHANPNSNQFQTNLAQTYFFLALLQRDTDQNDKALASFQKAIDIDDKLVRDNPAVSLFRHHLATDLWSLSNLQCDVGQFDDALKSGKRAQELLEKLGHDDPEYHRIQPDLGASFLVIGKAHRKMGQATEAFQAFQEAITTLEKVKSGKADLMYYNLACARALCSSLVASGKAELTAEQRIKRDRFADEAMKALRDAVTAGYANAKEMSEDPDLECLHSRDDFKQLVKELEAKAKPPEK